MKTVHMFVGAVTLSRGARDTPEHFCRKHTLSHQAQNEAQLTLSLARMLLNEQVVHTCRPVPHITHWPMVMMYKYWLVLMPTSWQGK